jgi:hypothetical protein
MDAFEPVDFSFLIIWSKQPDARGESLVVTMIKEKKQNKNLMSS